MTNERDDMAGQESDAVEVRRYVLHIRDEGDGMLWAEVEGLPGCFASGADMDELLDATVEAIGMYLAGPSEPGATVVDLPVRRASKPAHYAVDRAEILLEA